VNPSDAKELYSRFVELLKEKHSGGVYDGVFGAIMEVEIVNDGPVTFTLESPPFVV